MKLINNILAILMGLALILSSGTITAFANEIKSNDNKILIENGFPSEHIDVLSTNQKQELVDELKNNPTNVTITTSILEVDNLVEVENFLKCTDEELVNMGMDLDSVIETRKELNGLNKKSPEQISKEKNVSLAEATYYKKAIEKGLSGEINQTYKETTNPVTASGSISSSKLSYSQTVTRKSPELPNYSVFLSYTWASPFTVIGFNDEIVVAWGGGLNTKNESGSSRYYNCGTSWGSYYETNDMTKKYTPNAGLEFIFPQSVTTPQTISNGSRALAKTGGASFILYQTKKEGKETKIISHYCHRVIKVGTSIGISTSPSLSINIGSAWDKTNQASNNIEY